MENASNWMFVIIFIVVFIFVFSTAVGCIRYCAKAQSYSENREARYRCFLNAIMRREFQFWDGT